MPVWTFWTAATPDPEFRCSRTVQCALCTLLLDLDQDSQLVLEKKKSVARPACSPVTAATSVLALGPRILCQLLLNCRWMDVYMVGWVVGWKGG